MPSIKPKPSGLEVLGAFVTGDRGVANRRYREQADRTAQRDALAEEDAARERERHQVAIERVKRQQAEEEAAALRADQEASAAREATRWGIDRVKQDVAAQQRASGGKTDLDPETKAMLDKASRIADRLSPDAQRTFLTEVKGVAETARIAQAKDQAANKIADTIQSLGTSEIDASPFIQELQGAMELVTIAETPAQVAQAVQAANAATVKARQAVVAEHVKADTKAAAISSIQELYAGDPAKAKQASALSRAVQFGAMTPEAALEIAVKDKYGLKPKSAGEVAAGGGDLDTIWQTPQGRQAASWMIGEARGRALKLLPSVVAADASSEERQAALGGLLERELALVRAENGWYSQSPPQTGPAASDGMPSAPPPPDQAMSGPPGLTKHPLDKGRPPKVSLEEVRAATAQPEKPKAKQDDRDVGLAIKAEVVARAKREGWDLAKTTEELRKALADVGIK